MEINDEILKILKNSKLNVNNSLCYLLSLYFECPSTLIPDDLKLRVNRLGIIENENGTIKWNVPLFDNIEVHFNWVVTEYIPLFKLYNPIRAGFQKETVKRMKNLFAKNPEIRKEEVIEATKMYLSNTNPMYIKCCHYFIQKGVGNEKTEEILNWINLYKESTNKIRQSLNNKLQ